MSWMGTLAKVGMGVMVAKGVGKMINNRGAGGGMGGMGGATGGLGGMLGGMMGGGGQQGGAGGGLGNVLGGMMGGQQGGARSSGGGLGDVLGAVLGGGAAAGGLGSILSGSQGGAGGGLGGLLDSLSGGGAQQQQAGAGVPPAVQQGGFGGALNSAFDNFGEPAAPPTPSQEDMAKVMLRAMLTAAKSDGTIDEAEKEKVLGHLGDVSEDEMQFVRNELSSPVDIDGLVADIPKGMEQQAYVMSLMAIDLDSADEARYLDGLAKALGIQPEMANAIHDKVGAPKLYT